MAETMKSIADLLTAMPIGTDAGTSVQDIRDLLYSVGPRGGIIYISTPVETVISTVNTPVKVLGTTTLVTPTIDFTMPANNRLQFNGAAPINFITFCTVSIISASSNQDTTMSLALNGSVTTHTKVQRKIGTGSDIGSASVICAGGMSNGDYIEAFIENNTGTANITYENMTMVTMGWVV